MIRISALLKSFHQNCKWCPIVQVNQGRCEQPMEGGLGKGWSIKEPRKQTNKQTNKPVTNQYIDAVFFGQRFVRWGKMIDVGSHGCENDPFKLLWKCNLWTVAVKLSYRLRQIQRIRQYFDKPCPCLPAWPMTWSVLPVTKHNKYKHQTIKMNVTVWKERSWKSNTFFKQHFQIGEMFICDQTFAMHCAQDYTSTWSPMNVLGQLIKTRFHEVRKNLSLQQILFSFHFDHARNGYFSILCSPTNQDSWQLLESSWLGRKIDTANTEFNTKHEPSCRKTMRRLRRVPQRIK